MFSNIKKGDVISFGTGFGRFRDKELKWLVLDIQENRALLLLRDLIEKKFCFHLYADDITWETCTLRAMLNVMMYDRYMFTEAEKKRILLTHVVPDIKEGEVNINGEECHPGNETDDYLFLLSVNEAQKYFKDDDERVAVYEGQPSSPGEWWLRTPGDFGSINDYYACVNSCGGINRFGGINVADKGIRPAVWIDLRAESELDQKDNVWTGCDNARAYEIQNLFIDNFA